MTQSTEEFSRRAARAAPSLEPILREHLEDNFDEMLPHIFFGDVGRWVSEQVASSYASPEVAELLEFLETSYPTADFYVQNLFDVSFVENVQDDPAVVALFGPTLLSRVEPEYQPRQDPGKSWD